MNPDGSRPQKSRLSSSHTADAGVSNEGLLGVANTKGGDEDVSDFFNNLVSGLTIHSCVE
jgi:hypothetical protein